MSRKTYVLYAEHAATAFPDRLAEPERQSITELGSLEAIDVEVPDGCRLSLRIHGPRVSAGYDNLKSFRIEQREVRGDS